MIIVIKNNNNCYKNNSTISKTSKSNKKMVIWMTLETDLETRYTQSSVWPRRGLKEHCLFEWQCSGIASTTWLLSYPWIAARFFYRSPGL